jgi:hypothetical protein
MSTDSKTLLGLAIIVIFSHLALLACSSTIDLQMNNYYLLYRVNIIHLGCLSEH